MNETSLIVSADSPIGTISPRLYGHFAEHLGRCCYDGLWVGTDNSDIPHTNGFRTDVVNALRAMPVPLLRWPGGCYADHYHWRDGIGSPSQRPRRLGMSCGLQVEDDNSLGTHEFIAFCRMIGAEPYLAGNMGSGTPQELCDWMEYCNTSVNTTLAAERAANGSPQPFGVKLWGVGNENWGCGGNYDVDTYAIEYRRYATMLRHVDPNAELVACGFEDEWNYHFLRINQKHLSLVDHLSIHRYWLNSGTELDFNEEQYYALIREAHATEDFIRQTADHIRDFLGDSAHKIGVALDEYGVWHPEERGWGPNCELQRTPTTYEQANTLRDALAVAIALEGFHRKCDVLSMANLAQIVNVLHAPVMTEGASMWLTPTYYVFQLHAPHIGAVALPVEVKRGDSLPGDSSYIDAVTATASRRKDRRAITLINRHYDQPASVSMSFDGTKAVESAQILTANDPRVTNSANDPHRLQLVRLKVEALGAGQWRVDLPPHSIATIQFS